MEVDTEDPAQGSAAQGSPAQGSPEFASPIALDQRGTVDTSAVYTGEWMKIEALAVANGKTRIMVVDLMREGRRGVTFSNPDYEAACAEMKQRANEYLSHARDDTTVASALKPIRLLTDHLDRDRVRCEYTLESVVQFDDEQHGDAIVAVYLIAYLFGGGENQPPFIRCHNDGTVSAVLPWRDDEGDRDVHGVMKFRFTDCGRFFNKRGWTKSWLDASQYDKSIVSWAMERLKNQANTALAWQKTGADRDRTPLLVRLVKDIVRYKQSVGDEKCLPRIWGDCEERLLEILLRPKW